MSSSEVDAGRFCGILDAEEGLDADEVDEIVFGFVFVFELALEPELFDAFSWLENLSMREWTLMEADIARERGVYERVVGWRQRQNARTNMGRTGLGKK